MAAYALFLKLSEEKIRDYSSTLVLDTPILTASATVTWIMLVDKRGKRNLSCARLPKQLTRTLRNGRLCLDQPPVMYFALLMG